MKGILQVQEAKTNRVTDNTSKLERGQRSTCFWLSASFLTKASLLLIWIVIITTSEARQKDFRKGSCGDQKMQAEKPQRGLMS